MRLPYWVLRLLHRRRLSRRGLRGTWLHTRMGDRLLDKSLWTPSPESLARAWLIGFPITMMPFLPIQSLLACVIALAIRANLLLCIALQFLSTPFTAPVHLPACYLVGQLVRGRSPTAAWQTADGATATFFTGDALVSLYLGAAVLGTTVGIAGYALLRNFSPLARKHRSASPSP